MNWETGYMMIQLGGGGGGGIGGGVGAGRTSESQADLLQLTSDLEPDFKKINTT